MPLSTRLSHAEHIVVNPTRNRITSIIGRNEYLQMHDIGIVHFINEFFCSRRKFYIDFVVRGKYWNETIENISPPNSPAYLSPISLLFCVFWPWRLYERNPILLPSRLNHFVIAEYYRIIIGDHRSSTRFPYLSLKRFDCRPIRDARTGCVNVSNGRWKRQTIHWHSRFNAFSKSTCSAGYLRCWKDQTIVVFSTTISFRSIFLDRSTEETLRKDHSLNTIPLEMFSHFASFTSNRAEMNPRCWCTANKTR